MMCLGGDGFLYVYGTVDVTVTTEGGTSTTPDSAIVAISLSQGGQSTPFYSLWSDLMPDSSPALPPTDYCMCMDSNGQYLVVPTLLTTETGDDDYLYFGQIVIIPLSRLKGTGGTVQVRTLSGLEVGDWSATQFFVSRLIVTGNSIYAAGVKVTTITIGETTTYGYDSAVLKLNLANMYNPDQSGSPPWLDASYALNLAVQDEPNQSPVIGRAVDTHLAFDGSALYLCVVPYAAGAATGDNPSIFSSVQLFIFTPILETRSDKMTLSVTLDSSGQTMGGVVATGKFVAVSYMTGTLANRGNQLLVFDSLQMKKMFAGMVPKQSDLTLSGLNFTGEDVLVLVSGNNSGSFQIQRLNFSSQARTYTRAYEDGTGFRCLPWSNRRAIPVT